MQKVGGFFNTEAQEITDRITATGSAATTPAEDPIDQSGREGTINMLIDRIDDDFAFLVAEVEKNLLPE
jgi:hypothetical protein